MIDSNIAESARVIALVVTLDALGDKSAINMFAECWGTSDDAQRESYALAWAIVGARILGLDRFRDSQHLVGYELRSDLGEVTDPLNPARVFSTMMMAYVNDDMPVMRAAWRGLDHRRQDLVCATAAKIVLNKTNGRDYGSMTVHHQVVRPDDKDN